ncbi:hypothetical protein EJ04DRAFT_526649 [Polyplosphaeria fusca]|uniref:Uncharacterized protein n=1 Tax=Polyplosphaeria fusca TaxID=682080 RepID=A0A9P4QNP3_9PLEO|nr:hypothetical protein EJ04DRAFT_526649 [Polyplosphaeria fusca]
MHIQKVGDTESLCSSTARSLPPRRDQASIQGGAPKTAAPAVRSSEATNHALHPPSKQEGLGPRPGQGCGAVQPSLASQPVQRGVVDTRVAACQISLLHATPSPRSATRKHRPAPQPLIGHWTQSLASAPGDGLSRPSFLRLLFCGLHGDRAPRPSLYSRRQAPKQAKQGPCRSFNQLIREKAGLGVIGMRSTIETPMLARWQSIRSPGRFPLLLRALGRWTCRLREDGEHGEHPPTHPSLSFSSACTPAYTACKRSSTADGGGRP